MENLVALTDVENDGMFTVSRVRPMKDKNGEVQLMTCGCGCSGSVSVSNTLAQKSDRPEVLVLQR
jgi:hypothetical protein